MRYFLNFNFRPILRKQPIHTISSPTNFTASFILRKNHELLFSRSNFFEKKSSFVKSFQFQDQHTCLKKRNSIYRNLHILRLFATESIKNDKKSNGEKSDLNLKWQILAYFVILMVAGSLTLIWMYQKASKDLRRRKHVSLWRLKKAFIPIIFVIGGPGSGKSTQCVKMMEKYGFSALSPNDLLKDEIKLGTERGLELTKIMESGQPAPLEIVLDLVKQAMLEKFSTGSRGFLVDDYYREITTDDQFEREIRPNLVIYFEASDEIMTQRLLDRSKISGHDGGDENLKEKIKKRLEIFHEQTQPVVDYYKQKGKLFQIKAEGSVENTFKEVTKAYSIIMGDLNKLERAYSFILMIDSAILK